ncbi:MAG: hypothetical protein M3Y33_19800, partial [Actinomycetota bacterium]|nr:hypothetical protein [Actinomycetota bacterium]
VTPIVLHLRPGTREWFERWLAQHHPALTGAYQELYGRRAYAPRAYQGQISARVRDLARQHRVGARSPRMARQPTFSSRCPVLNTPVRPAVPAARPERGTFHRAGPGKGMAMSSSAARQ